jgi:uracil-DNA glycosylase family 4
MISKPKACIGCPLYGDGRGFVPGDVQGRKVLVMGQCPDEEEEAQGVPFIGKTAQLLERSFLPLAGLNREDIDVDYAIRCRSHGALELPPLESKLARTALDHCQAAHGTVPKGQLVVAQGAYPLYTLTGETSISAWRGWLMFNKAVSPGMLNGIYTPSKHQLGVPILATLNLAALYTEPGMQDPTRMDWSKVAAILAGKWPETLPEIKTYPPRWLPHTFAYDTEYVPETGQLIREQYGWRNEDGPHIHVVEARDSVVWGTDYRPRVILQNAPADIPYLNKLLPGGYSLDDTLLAHARLWSDLPHDLDFLGSLYARTNRWKMLARSSPLVYAGADALGTWDVWSALAGELARDPQTEVVYRQSVACWPIVARARAVGLKVARDVARSALVDLKARCLDAELEAQAAVGWPIKLSSPLQVAFQIYDVENAKRRKA